MSSIVNNVDIGKLIEEANKPWGQRRPSLETRVSEMIDKINTDVDPAKSSGAEVANQRNHLLYFLDLTEAYYQTYRKKAINVLVRCFENDLIREVSRHEKLADCEDRAYRIVDVAKTLLEKCDPEKIQGALLEVQLGLVKALGLCIELIYFYNFEGSLGGQKNNFKQELLGKIGEVERLNTHDHPELGFAVNYATEAIKRLPTDISKIEKVAEILLNIGSVAISVTTKIYYPFSYMDFQVCQDRLVEVAHIINENFIKEDWFDRILNLKALSIKAKVSTEALATIFILTHEQKTKDYRFLIGAINILGAITLDNLDEKIIRMVLHGLEVENEKKDKKLEGLLRFISCDYFNREQNLNVQLHAIRMLCRIREDLKKRKVVNDYIKHEIEILDKELKQLEDFYFSFDDKVHIGQFIASEMGSKIPLQPKREKESLYYAAFLMLMSIKLQKGKEMIPFCMLIEDLKSQSLFDKFDFNHIIGNFNLNFFDNRVEEGNWALMIREEGWRVLKNVLYELSSYSGHRELDLRLYQFGFPNHPSESLTKLIKFINKGLSSSVLNRQARWSCYTIKILKLSGPLRETEINALAQLILSRRDFDRTIDIHLYNQPLDDKIEELEKAFEKNMKAYDHIYIYKKPNYSLFGNDKDNKYDKHLFSGYKRLFRKL